MRKSLATIAAVGLLGMTAGNLKADAAPAAPKWYDKVSVAGYLDGYYQYDLNGRSAPSGPVGRAFDTTQEQFTFNAAKLGLTWSDSKSATGAELDLLYGNIAALTNLTSNNASVGIEQGYMTQAFGPITFKLGKFGTFLGTEVTDTPGNMNYSRSILFTAIPFYHTGLMGTYAIMDGLAASLYIGDGNSVDFASNEDKDFGAQVVYTKIKNLSLTLNYYNQTLRNPALPFNVFADQDDFNFLASYVLSDSFTFAGEYLYETEIANTKGGNPAYDPKEQGGAIYVDYTTPVAGLSIIPRYEMWYQPDASGPVGAYPLTAFGPTQKAIADFTLTVKYAMGPLTHYLEYRMDDEMGSTSDTPPTVAVFPAAGGAAPSYTQSTITYAAVYGF